MELRNLFRRKTIQRQPITLNDLGDALATLSDDDKRKLADALVAVQKPLTLGDGRATFLEPMTDDEYARWVHEEDHGWKKVYDILLGRSKPVETPLSRNENGDY